MTQANGITRFAADVERAPRKLAPFFALTKPRVVSLIVDHYL